MNRVDIRNQFAYNDWANERVCEMLKNCFGEETDLRALEDKRGLAIQETTAHIIGAQAAWRLRCGGVSPTQLLDPQEYPTPLALRMAFGAERARFQGFLDTLEDDAALESIVSATSTTGESRVFPLWQILQHVLTHSGYHRGQITARLLDMGYEESVIATDFTKYCLLSSHP